MKKSVKILLIIALIAIFIWCFIPAKDYNCKYPLNIETPYGDIEAYHPKVLSFENGWNGHKYWMSYTPYPKGDDSKENPCIAVSDDLIHWSTPEGLTNPLDERVDDGEPKQYNSDSHIVYRPDTDELECYWRFVDDVNDQVIIYRRKSKDGVNWTEKEVAMKATRSKKDYISPAIIFEDNIYKIWYVDKSNKVTYATSENGLDWKDVKVLNISYEKKIYTWHLDVIRTEKGYEMIAVAYDKWANHNDMSLYYTSSKDGITWEKAKTILEPTVTTNYWDNKGLYRSSFIYENGMYYVFYGGTSKSYNHGIGLVYGKDIFKLNKVGTDFKNEKQVEKLKKDMKIK